MKFIRKLPIPQAIKEDLPLGDGLKIKKEALFRELEDIFTSKSERFLLIVGPCSADREEPILEYCRRLRGLSDALGEHFLIIPRLFTSKPRTLGAGYTGISSRPAPSGDDDMLRGIIAARRMLLRVAEESGFFGADEILYPENLRYYSDLIAYATVGARSSEDQMHRLLASGLDVPVGMKNPPSGDISVMFNSIYSSRQPHRFVYRGWEVESEGNPLSHAVIRGADYEGAHLPNYRRASLLKIASEYEKRGLTNPALIVDASHGNSLKKPEKQGEVCQDVIKSMKEEPAIRKLVKGFMIESYLLSGAQPLDGQEFGKSFTDPCLSWEETERIVYDIANGIEKI